MGVLMWGCMKQLKKKDQKSTSMRQLEDTHWTGAGTGDSRLVWRRSEGFAGDRTPHRKLQEVLLRCTQANRPQAKRNSRTDTYENGMGRARDKSPATKLQKE